MSAPPGSAGSAIAAAASLGQVSEPDPRRRAGDDDEADGGDGSDTTAGNRPDDDDDDDDDNGEDKVDKFVPMEMTSFSTFSRGADTGPDSDDNGEDNGNIDHGSSHETDIGPSPAPPSVSDTAPFTPQSQRTSLGSPAPDSRSRTPLSSRLMLRPFDRRFSSAPTPSLADKSRSPRPGRTRLDDNSTAAAAGTAGTAPVWPPIRFTMLDQLSTTLFSPDHVGRFGEPTCVTAGPSVIAVGTSTGVVCVFDYGQTLVAAVGHGNATVGPVSVVALSADETAVAAGHATGAIDVWDLNKPAKPLIDVPPLAPDQVGKPDRSWRSGPKDGHVTGTAVIYLSFLGRRRTAVVSADSSGMVFSHLASRGLGSVGRAIETTRLLGRYRTGPASEPALPDSIPPPSRVIGCSTFPVGPDSNRLDELGLTALLTPEVLVVVSTTPVPRTYFKTRVGPPGSDVTGAVAWFPAGPAPEGQPTPTNDSTSSPSTSAPALAQAPTPSKLAFAAGPSVRILDVDAEMDPDMPDALPRPRFKHVREWTCPDTVVAIAWLSRVALVVVSARHRLFVLDDVAAAAATPSSSGRGRLVLRSSADEVEPPIKHVDPLLPPAVCSVVVTRPNRGETGRLVVLGPSHLSIGSIPDWADRLAVLAGQRDYIAALRLGVSLFEQTDGPGASTTDVDGTVGLPSNRRLRRRLLAARVVDIGRSGVSDALSKHLDDAGLSILTDAVFHALCTVGQTDILYDTFFDMYAAARRDGVFLSQLEADVLSDSRTVSDLPASLVRHLLLRHKDDPLPVAGGDDSDDGDDDDDTLQNILVRLDVTTIDFELATSICRSRRLWAGLAYVWTQAAGDVVTPAIDMLRAAIENHDDGGGDDVGPVDSARTTAHLFSYLGHVLTGRVYPSGKDIGDERRIRAGQADIVWFLFAEGPVRWPRRGGDVVSIGDSARHGLTPEPFPYLRLLLRLDPAGLLSVLNDFFEEPFLDAESDDSADGGADDDDDGDFDAVTSISTRMAVVAVLLEVIGNDPTESGSPVRLPDDDYDNSVSPETVQRMYLDIFIARAIAKFPQFVVLPASRLRSLLIRLCTYPTEWASDCQLSAEYLLSVYRPSNVADLLPTFRSASFFRLIRAIHSSDHDYPALVRAWLDDPDPSERVGVFGAIADAVRWTGTAGSTSGGGSGITTSTAAGPVPSASRARQTRTAIEDVITDRADEVCAIDAVAAADTLALLIRTGSSVQTVVQVVGNLSSDRIRFDLVRGLVDHTNSHHQRGADTRSGPFIRTLAPVYVRLLCQFDPDRAAPFIRSLPSAELELDDLVPELERAGAVDAAVLLDVREPDPTVPSWSSARRVTAIRRVVRHLSVLETGLGSAVEHASVDDLLAEVNKYARIGVWVCRLPSTGRDRSDTDGAGDDATITTATTGSADSADAEDAWTELMTGLISTVHRLTSLSSSSSLPPSSPSLSHPDQARPIDERAKIADSVRTTVQRAFSVLLADTATSSSLATKTGRRSDVEPRGQPNGDAHATDQSPMFLRIFTRLLHALGDVGSASSSSSKASQPRPSPSSQPSSSSPPATTMTSTSSLAAIRPLLTDSFASFTFESAIVGLATSILSSDVGAAATTQVRARRRGWRAGQVRCGVCGRRCWGVGVGAGVWDAWLVGQDGLVGGSVPGKGTPVGGLVGKGHDRLVGRGEPKGTTTTVTAMVTEEQQGTRLTESRVTDFNLVVFACRHAFHARCLGTADRPTCLLCQPTREADRWNAPET